MRTLLLLAVIVMTLTSIAVKASRTHPVDTHQVAEGLNGVHAVDVVENATKRRLAAADL